MFRFVFSALTFCIKSNLKLFQIYFVCTILHDLYTFSFLCPLILLIITKISASYQNNVFDPIIGTLKSLLTQLNSRTPTLTPNPYYPRTLTLTLHLSLTNIALQTVNSEFSVPSIFSDFLFKFSSNRFNYYLLFFLIFYRTTIFKQNFNQ